MAGVSDDKVRVAFEAVAARVLDSNVDLNNDQKLELYGLFKQANAGDVATSRPGIFAPRERAKWDAWSKCAGMSTRDAMVAYVRAASDMGLV